MALKEAKSTAVVTRREMLYITLFTMVKLGHNGQRHIYIP